MLGKLNKNEIEAVFQSQVFGRIGCHADNKTYIVPISYAYDGDYIYGHTEEGMKIDIMRKNANVCFEVDVLENMANWKSILAWGKYEELNDPVEREKALRLLLGRTLPLISSETTHLSEHWPFPPEDFNNIEGVVFRIHLDKKTGRYERNVFTSQFG